MNLVSGQFLIIFALYLTGTYINCCQDGEVIKLNESCDEYNLCKDGKLVRQRCKLGQHFNGKKCDDFWNVNCIAKCTENMIYERGFCAKDYDVCIDGVLKRHLCPALHRFDGKYCVPLESCSDPTKCKEGAVINVKGSSYMKCVNSEYVQQQCKNGLIYDKYTQTCHPFSISFAAKSKFCTDPDRKSVAGDCSKYQECVRGEFITRQCPDGMLFDVNYLMCRNDYEAQCSDDSCVENTLMPVEQDCDSYYACKDGNKKKESCGLLKHFDPVLEECTYSKQCERIECVGDYVQVSDNCKEYTICQNGYKNTYQCPLWFNYVDGECRWFQKCKHPNALIMKKQCEEGQVRSILGRCSEYQQCVDNKWRTMKCPEGTNFQVDKCEAKKCPLIPVLNHCGKFKMSVNDDKSYDCPFGYLFDKVQRQCQYTAAAICEDSECVDKQLLNHPSDCNKYKECVNGKWVIQTCPKLQSHFDLDTKQCKFWSYNCNFEEVPCKTGDKRPVPSDCKKYEECVDNSWRINSCHFWQHFDSAANSCATFSYKCAVNINEELITQAEEVTAIEKTNPKIIVNNNDNNNNKKKSLAIFGDDKCSDGDIKIVDGTCRWYTVCEKGEIITKRCSPCTNFNVDSKKCEWVWKKPCPSDVTDPPEMTTTPPKTPTPTVPPTKKPVECKENDKEGVKNDCKVYRLCKNGKWVNQKCNVWGKFDIKSKACVYFAVWSVTCA